MSFFTKVASGGLLVAGVTYYYHIDIRATSERLSRDLHALSQQLIASTPVAPTARTERVFPEPVPSRLGLAESIKARWNEKLESSVVAMRETEWSQLASNTWAHAKYGVARLQDKIAPAAAASEVAEGRRQV